MGMGTPLRRRCPKDMPLRNRPQGSVKVLLGAKEEETGEVAGAGPAGCFAYAPPLTLCTRRSWGHDLLGTAFQAPPETLCSIRRPMDSM